MNFIEILGLCAGACTTLSFIPQLKKVLVTKSVKDISFQMYAMYCTGLTLWTIYGVLMHSISLILANFLTLLLAFSIVIMKIRLETNEVNVTKDIS